jgi:hypothetical protein
LLSAAIAEELELVWVYCAPDAVDTVVWAPDDELWYHPKHVEQFPDKINCVTLHLFGYILESFYVVLTLSDPTSNLVQQYDFPVPLRCRKTSETAFVAFVRPLSESARRFSSCSTEFSQQIAQVVLFLVL